MNTILIINFPLHKDEVIAEKVSDWQTDYIFKSVQGDFNFDWFEEIKSKTFMAIA